VRSGQLSEEAMVAAYQQFGSYRQVVTAIENAKPSAFLAVKGLPHYYSGIELLNGHLLEDPAKRWQFVHDSKVYPSSADTSIYIRSIGQFKQSYYVFGTNVSTKQLNEWIKDKSLAKIKEHVVSVAKLDDEGACINTVAVKYTREWGMFSRCPLLAEPVAAIQHQYMKK
jgi:hypothetical protein